MITLEKEEKIKEEKRLLESNGYKVHIDYSYLMGKWVAFRQKGMRPVLHGKVILVDIFGHCKIKCKRAKIRYTCADKIIGIYNRKSDCYAVK